MAKATDFPDEPCIQYEGRCVSWAPRGLVYSPDGRALYFPFAFHHNRRQLTPWAIGKLDLRSGELSLVERSCDFSYPAIALADDGKTRAMVISTPPKKYTRSLGSFVVQSFYRLRLDMGPESLPRTLFTDNNLEIWQLEFQAEAKTLYFVRPHPTGRAWFERINLADFAHEGAYPLAVPADRVEREDFKRLFSSRSPGFSFYSNFSIHRGGRQIATIGWSPTTVEFLQPLTAPRNIEDRIARTLHLIYVIDLPKRELVYHEIHNRDEFSRRWIQYVQYVGDSLFFMPEREWHERSSIIYQFKDGKSSKRAEIPGIAMRVVIDPPGRTIAYVSRELDKNPNPSVFLTIAALDGGSRLRIGPKAIARAFSRHLECKDFYTRWRDEAKDPPSSKAPD